MTEEILDEGLADSSNETDKMKKTSLKKMFMRIIGYKKVILMIAVFLFLLLSLILMTRLVFFKEPAGKIQDTMISSKDTMPEAALKREAVFEDIVNLDPFERIQLKESSAMGLISLHLSLELTDHRYRNRVCTMRNRIRNIITGQAKEMTWLLLRSPEGKIMLKYRLLKRINSIFPEVMVSNIYFTYFIMQ